MKVDRIPGIDKDVSRIVQGTVMLTSKELEAGLDLLDSVYELGCRTFDGAHIYGGGDVERVIGKWLARSGKRDDVVIISKGCHPNRDRNRVTPFDIAADLHDSLVRLQTDYVDLYLLHRDDEDVPVAVIVEALNEQISAGRVHAIGGSNWTHERTAEANEYAAANGLAPFVASSPNYSLADQVEPPWAGCISISGKQGEAARAWYAEQNMPLFTWSSLANGFFTGRFTRENLDAVEAGYEDSSIKAYCSEENFDRLDRVQELADEKGMSVAQIATAYIFNQPLNIFALIGCRTADEFAANKAAMDLDLSAAEIAWLNLERDDRS